MEWIYRIFDALLGWSVFFGPVGAVAIVGVLTGLATMLLQKFASRQAFLRQCKEDLRRLKERIRSASGDDRRRLRGLSGRIGGKYMWAALRPALLTVPLIGIVALWAGERLGSMPVRPDETISVRAHFEDGAEGFAHIVPGEGFACVGPAVGSIEVPREEPAGRQARWEIRATREGSLPLTIRYADQVHCVEIPVSRSGGRPPQSVTVFCEKSASQDRLQAVEIRLLPSMEPDWWNVWLGWTGLYLLVATLAALAGRPLLRVS